MASDIEFLVLLTLTTMFAPPVLTVSVVFARRLYGRSGRSAHGMSH